MRGSAAALLLLRLLLLLHAAAAGNGGCARSCGALTVQYPFGFSPGCEIPLGCDDQANGTAWVGGARELGLLVSNVTARAVVLVLPQDCSRGLNASIQALFSKSYAPGSQNALVVSKCSPASPSHTSNCSDGDRYLDRSSRCNATTEPIRCVLPPSISSSASVHRFFNRIEMQTLAAECTGLVSAASYWDAPAPAPPALLLGVMELEWWVGGTCRCSRDATCTPVTTPIAGQQAFRCECREGYDGDGFADGAGCRRASKCNPSKYLSGDCGKTIQIALLVAAMADDSGNVGSDDDFSMRSEDENSESLNVGEDSNCSDDEIDPVGAVEALKGLRGVMSGRGRARRTRKNTSHVEGKGKRKSAAGASSYSRAASRCNNKYFGDIISALDDHKKDIIRGHGFGRLLDYDGCSVPRGFVQWIADQVDVNCRDILVGGKVIPCSPESVHLCLGIPFGGEDIKQQYNDSVKTKFLLAIKEKSLPLKSTFGDKLKGNTLSEDDIFRYFMVVALSFFLCPNSSTIPSPKYLGPLLDVSTVKDWDWSKFVFDWLFSSISSYKKNNRQTIGGCIYFLAAYYLDFLDFGFVRELPPTLPRIKCWKGSMIKDYAKYDRVSDSKFGKRPVKSFEDTCYVVDCGFFRKTLDKHCDFIKEEDKDGMCELFEEHHTRVGYRNPATLVSKVLKYLYEASLARRGAHVHAESSAGRVPSPVQANVDDEGVDAVPPEVVLDARFPAGPSDKDVKDVDHAAGPNGEGVEQVAAVVCPSVRTVEEEGGAAGKDPNFEDFEAKNASVAKTDEEEASATEIIESDGMYGSQGTEILPRSSSSAQASCRNNKKRKSNTSQSLSPDSVGSMSNRKMSLRLSTRLAGFSPISGPGATVDNPVIVEEAGAQTSKRGRKGRSKANASSPSIEEITSDVSPVCHTKIGGKRNQKIPQSSSPAIVSRKSPRGVSKKLGRSPLSRVDDGNDGLKNAESASRAVPGLSKVANARDKHHEGTKDTPVLVEEGPVLASKPTTKRRKVVEGSTGAAGLSINKIENTSAPVDKTNMKNNAPYFNSPSMPSFRIFEDEDDLGNYVEDPNLRRPVGPVSGTACPIDVVKSVYPHAVASDTQGKVKSVLQTTCTSEDNHGANVSHGAIPVNVQCETSFYFQFCPGPEKWTFIDQMRSNPFGRPINVSNQESVESETNVNVENDFVHMESLPFTETPPEDPDAPAPMPLAAVSPSGEHIDLVATPLPSHRVGSFVCAKSMGSNGLSEESESFSNQVAWCSSSAMLAVHRPKRTLITSKYKLSPYMIPQSKIIVSRLEADMYDVVLKMAEYEHSKTI